MDNITETELRAVLDLGRIAARSYSDRTESELSFEPPAARVVIVYVGEDRRSAYADRVVSAVLGASESWLLVPRFGKASQLSIAGAATAAALRFSQGDAGALKRYLCERPMHIGEFDTDLYLLSPSGSIKICWDHHSAEEGVVIELREVSDASRLLESLNEAAAEVELYSAEPNCTDGSRSEKMAG
jgi:hypothetical protein